MTQRDNILQELTELRSPLKNHIPEPVYTVPEGYFDGLAATVLARIRAMNAAGAKEELSLLSPFLGKLPVHTPYTVPAGYFDELNERVLQLIEKNSDPISAAEETAGLSPLLGSLNKTMPYGVPEGYFDTLHASAEKKKPTGAKLIALGSHAWFRYAAAAVVTGIIAMAGFLVFNSGKEKTEGGKVFAKVSKDIRKLNDSQQDYLIDFLDAGMSGTETVKSKTDTRSKEIRQLLQDIPEDELKIFQEQTEDIEDVLLIN